MYLDHHNLHNEFVSCMVCGAEGVDIHHIDAKGMGGKAGKNRPDNLIALCRSCHEKAHRSEFSKAYLRSLIF